MEYWLVYKPNHGMRNYICGTDENGSLIHTREEKEALKFYHFAHAMSYFNLGYCITKRYS